MIELDQKILEQILEIGGRLLTAGGEAKRVESAISHLCTAYGATSADVFVITSSIVVTARFDDGEPLTQTKRINGYSHNLSEFNALNSLSRAICENPVPADEIRVMIRNLKHVRRPLLVKILCWALISASFSIFFGGSLMDGFVSTFMGIALCLLKSGCEALCLGNHFSIIICSVIGGLLGILPGIAGLGVSQFYICIGSVMLFIPGMGLTNSIRDMLAGDTITGLLRFIESLIVSMAVACGFAAFAAASDTTRSAHEIAQLTTAFLGSLGFAFVFNAKLKNAIIGALCGLCGWGAVILCIRILNSELLGYFVAAALITLAA
ncbi:MAG: threonine/serine exporter family protein, partial [Clostridia bacterium]|nr:threonine/serine exporter family protein [Clostridia bacterium]